MQVLFTQNINGENGIILTVSLSDFAPLPSPYVFIYQNTGTNVLGQYQGVCNLSELTKYQIWTGTPIPIFANAFVLGNQGIMTCPTAAAVTQNIELITFNLSALKTQYLGSYPSTTTVTI